ncbi:type VI secretion system Vgr family protein [Acinetobacter soli]|uniref:type VI secretion system Vgr family protein n=1 Tax=Acinetobacter soli TaxID=487316 RepID=UPI001ABC5F76|nr:type VI secretion system Vgr family protein [Acinetobacter soli]MBO3641006.1 type VI secretion system tip protein VgrG [Acinetobacter soli]WOQ36534.1 type VI secretion system Vgr family protein [Acinetobacter soli]
MLSNMNGVLEQLGLGALKRAVHVQFSHAALNAQVFLQRIEGKHALNDGLSVELTCLSTNAHIALKQFIGCRVAVDQVTDSGALARTSGIITRATQGQSDGALTIYTLTLQDPTALWHKRRNSRVFINKSVPEISEILFKEWQSKSRLFAASLTLDLSGLSQDYDIRPLSIQMNETDYEFLTRLWRSEGINWLVDEKHVVVAHALQEMAPQKLRLIDHNQPFLALERGVIRFHRSHATEYFDSMTQLVAHRQLQSTATYLQRWQADALIQDEGNGSIQSAHLYSEQHSNESLSLEQAWSIEPAWTTDLTGADQATISSAQQIEKLNQNMTAYQEFQAKYFTAHSSVRDAQVGYWFELTGHPEIDTHERADRQFLIYEKQFYNQNNLPKALQQQVERLQPTSTLNFLQNQERQGNQLSLIRRQIKLVPDYQPLVHRPAVYPQRARVVGSENEEIHVDEWGRIKVRFLFTRAEDHAHDTGAGSNENDTDSAWVDVLTPWAGEQYGARFLPRVGELVVIDFFDGHVDRPFVIGRIHEGQRSPTKFDVKGQLPATRNLSGIRSKEVAGSGFNQLRFDDTTGQISAQLQSSHGTSQLNLGNLSHPKNEETSQGRGEGFELRTDHYGAVRAGQGMLISTYAQEQAQSQHLSAKEASHQLNGNLNNVKALSEVANNQQTDPLEGLDKLKQFVEQIEQEDKSKATAFKQAMMILSAPDSIALSSNADIYLSADGQISHYVEESINFSTQNNLIAHAQNRMSLFAAKAGIEIIAAKQKIEAQAQSDGIDLIAKKEVRVISTEDTIHINSPKKIILTGGSSQIEIGNNILFKTDGLFKAKAGQHRFESGANVVAPKVSLPTAKTLYSNKVNYNWNIKSEGTKEIFILDNKNNNVIKTKSDQLDTDNNISSLRFYTSQETEFTALAFNSDYIHMKQEISDQENTDELLEEALNNESESGDVYTEGDFHP